ncbi:MAG: cytochrome P460 family protein [Burkholderiales bacterium]
MKQLSRSVVRVSLLAGAVAAGISAIAVVAQTAATVAPGPNKLVFPADWAKGVMYATVDRPDTRQYREFYSSAEAVKAARAGQPIPDGTIITLAAYSIKMDGDKPALDANGRFIKDRLVAVNSMQKKKGFGDDIPAPIRNGDWIYQSFSPTGEVNMKANLTACYQCHLPFAKDDYLTNLAKLQGRFPQVAKVDTPSGISSIAIRGFAFGPEKLRVQAGQSITWTNADDTPHQVSVVGRSERSGLMLKGQSATMKFDAAGSLDYICGLHPTMKGTIEVTAQLK